jgi:hypothetical protein
MFNKLRALKTAQGGSTPSTWMTRFRFSVKDTDREKSLKMVEKWIGRMGPLLRKLERVRGSSQSQEQIRPPSYQHMRELVVYLHNALITHWRCACVPQRKVKMFLDGQELAKSQTQSNVSFQLLFHKPVAGQQGISGRWLEGNVVVCPAPRYAVPYKFLSTLSIIGLIDATGQGRRSNSQSQVPTGSC